MFMVVFSVICLVMFTLKLVFNTGSSRVPANGSDSPGGHHPRLPWPSTKGEQDDDGDDDGYDDNGDDDGDGDGDGDDDGEVKESWPR